MTDTRSGIENTLARYSWSYDMNEFDAIGECFTRDAEVDFGPNDVVRSGRGNVVAELRSHRVEHTGDDIPWHVITNVYITDETTERATVRSWWTFFVQSTDGSQAFRKVGWYDDVFVLEDGAWRIKHRRVLYPHGR